MACNGISSASLVAIPDRRYSMVYSDSCYAPAGPRRIATLPAFRQDSAASSQRMNSPRGRA